MDPAKLREIASKGGKESQSRGTAHRFRSKAEASRLGKIGGLRSGKVRGKKKTVWIAEHPQDLTGAPPWPEVGTKKAAPPAHAREADDAATGSGSGVEDPSIPPNEDKI